MLFYNDLSMNTSLSPFMGLQPVIPREPVTPTWLNLYPSSQVGVLTGWGTGWPGKPQENPCYSLCICHWSLQDKPSIPLPHLQLHLLILFFFQFLSNCFLPLHLHPLPSFLLTSVLGPLCLPLFPSNRPFMAIETFNILVCSFSSSISRLSSIKGSI